MPTACLSHPNQFGLLSTSEWAISPLHTLLLPVQRGDFIHALQGTVWVTVDGQSQDLFISGGATHTMVEDALLHITGFVEPRLKVLSRRPLRAAQGREVSDWRNWLRKARIWTPLHANLTVRIAA